jgi:hypothetical protein
MYAANALASSTVMALYSDARKPPTNLKIKWPQDYNLIWQVY